MNTRPVYGEANLDALMAAVFTTDRTLRSPEYVAGCRAGLACHLGLSRKPESPHPVGTAAADAWWAGLSEAYDLMIRSPGALRRLASTIFAPSQAQAIGWGSAGQCPALLSAKTPAAQQSVSRVVNADAGGLAPACGASADGLRAAAGGGVV